MKNLLLLILVLLTSTTFAQTKKGNFVLSGSTGLMFSSSSLKYVYDGETQGKGTMSSLSLSPTFAYFVMDNLAVGLSSTFSSSTSKGESGNKDVSSTTLILPTAIYYFPMEGKIRPFAQVGAGLSSQAYKYIPKTGSDEKDSYSGLAVNFGAGFAYFIKENISFNLGLSYTMVTLTNGDDDKSKMKQGSFASNLGIAVYF